MSDLHSQYLASAPLPEAASGIQHERLLWLHLGVLAAVGWQLQQAALRGWGHCAASLCAGLVLAALSLRGPRRLLRVRRGLALLASLGLRWCARRPGWRGPLRCRRRVWSRLCGQRARWPAPVLRAGLRAGGWIGVGLLLGWGWTGARALLQQGTPLDPALQGRTLVLSGMVASMPQRTAHGLRFRWEVEHASLDRQPVSVPTALLLNWRAPPGQRPPLRAGQRWRLAVRLRLPHAERNPFGPDGELWMWEQGLGASGSVRQTQAWSPVSSAAGANEAVPMDDLEEAPEDPLAFTAAALTAFEPAPADTQTAEPAPRRLPPRAWAWLDHPLERWRQDVRERIEHAVAEPELAGVLSALVVGDQAAIDRANWALFRQTGVAHLMSISGLHITLFAWLAGWAVGALWRRQARLCLWLPAVSAARVLGLGLATLYALFSGWGVPAQRTVCMLACAMLLRASGRQWPWSRVWLMVLVWVLLLDPWALLQAGFWLSFVAVAVLFASDAGAPGLAPAQVGPEAAARPDWRMRMRGMLHEQWVVTLALAPLSLLLFGQVSWVGLLANLLAIPLVTLGVTPLAMLGLLWPPLWVLAGQLLAGLLWVLHHMGSWPYASVYAAVPALWAGVAAVLGGLLCVLPWPWLLRVWSLPLLLPALLWHTPAPPWGEFELLALDVGQGNAVLLRTARHTWIYDTGPGLGGASDAGQRVLLPVLRGLGLRPDRLVLSHRDSDHTGGAASVLAAYPGLPVLSSLERGHALQSPQPHQRCVAGQTWELDGVRISVLQPPAGAEAQALAPNALSCVLRIANGRQAALLTGDLEAPQERQLLARAAPLLKADWLLVPHHGSQTSSSPAFLQAVAPRWAVLQAGFRNRYGHPAPAVLARYRALGLSVQDSVHCGALWWRSQQPERIDCQRADTRYWQHRMDADSAAPVP